MENTELYIKYDRHQNQPVPINTHVNNERTALRLFPLTTVGHLIAAYFPSAEPSTLAQYTLHSINNEEETSYNSWDPLTILGENGRTGISPLIIKSLNDAQSQDVVTGNFQEITNKALEKYCHNANILMNDPCVHEVCEFLIKTTSEKFPNTESTYPPFVFLEGSSGSGKSQMAFAIKAKIESQRQVYYFLFNPPVACSQTIYLNFTNISKLFTNCYTKDMHLYSENLSPSCGSIFEKNLYVYGFIYELLSKRIESSDVNIGPKTGKDVQDLIMEKNLDQSRPVFILDECVAILVESFNKVRFVRNCFLSLGLGLVLLGTDYTAAKLPGNIAHSSRNELPRQWCYVVGKFPALNLELLELPPDTPYWLKYMLSHSRPLFSHLVAAKFEKNLNDFDALMNEVFTHLTTIKKIFANKYGKLGQLRLFQNAHYLLENWNNLSTSLIHSHFAQLNEPEKNFFLMNDGCISGNDSEWKPSSAFPKVQDDILLYLLLMGGKGYPAFRLNSQQVPYSHVLMQFKGNPDDRDHILDFSNAVQKSKDGMFLEALLCSTVCLASHSNGIQGIVSSEYQLQIDKLNSDQIKISGLEQLNQFDFTVPFLSPANQMWPNDAKLIPGSNFGDLGRAKNADKIDLWTSCHLFGEAKDYGSKINLKVMKQILKRVPEQAIVELVFIRKLESSYYVRSESSFENDFSGSHITSKAFYKIDASKHDTILETIRGIPCAENPDGVVIFFEINDELSL